VVVGGIWFLKGINVLPGSFMTGEIRWAIYGGIAVAAGISVLLAVNQLRRADDDDRDVEHISQGPARQIRPPKELPKAHAEAVVSPLHPLSTFLSTLIPVSCGITPPAARPTRPRELGTT